MKDGEGWRNDCKVDKSTNLL